MGLPSLLLARSFLYQLQLPRLYWRDAHTLDFTVRGFENLEAQAMLFDGLALVWNSARQFADQAGDRRRFFPLRLHAEKFIQAIDIHSTGNDECPFPVTNDFGLVAVVTNFAHDLFDQILDGDQSRHAAIFIDDDRHADVLLLHLAQKIAAQLAFGNKVDIPPHDGIERAQMSFRV